MIQIIVSIVYILVLLFSSTFTAGGFDPSQMDLLLSDSTKLLYEHANSISGVYSILIIAAALLVLHGLSRNNPRAVRREHVDPGQWGSAVLVILGAVGLVSILIVGIQLLAQVVPAIQTAMDNYNEMSKNFVGSGSIPLIILTTCIAVPIAEDLVFRGIIQGELRRAMPAWLAISIQAVIFALVHGDPIQISYVIIPAVFLGLVYEWTKSIYVPIVMHMTFNLVGSVVTMVVQDMTQAGTVVSIAGFTADPNTIFFMAEMAMIPFAIIALVFLYKRRRQDLPEPALVQGPSDISAALPAYAEAVSDNAKWKHRDND
jgi:membrane protease YdiL (CAAX protease family)